MAEKSRAQILGKNLKRIREEKGVSRKQLAEATGITANMIGEYETGKKLPPLDKIFNIANFFKISITDLTGDTSFADNEYNSDYPQPANTHEIIINFNISSPVPVKVTYLKAKAKES